MKKVFSVLSLASLLLANTAFSNQPTKPDVCPSVANIAAEGFDYVGPFVEDAWVAMKDKSNYDTQDAWSFILLIPEASNAREAKYKAAQLVKKLTLVEGPHSDNDGSTGCVYTTDPSHDPDAMATNPPANIPTGSAKLLQMMRSKA